MCVYRLFFFIRSLFIHSFTLFCAVFHILFGSKAFSFRKFHVSFTAAAAVVVAAAAAEWSVCMWKYWLLDHCINWRIDTMRINEYEKVGTLFSVHVAYMKLYCIEIGKLPLFYAHTHNIRIHTCISFLRTHAMCNMLTLLICLWLAFHPKIFSHSVSMLIGLCVCVRTESIGKISKCLIVLELLESLVVCLLFHL